MINCGNNWTGQTRTLINGYIIGDLTSVNTGEMKTYSGGLLTPRAVNLRATCHLRLYNPIARRYKLQYDVNCTLSDFKFCQFVSECVTSTGKSTETL